MSHSRIPGARVCAIPLGVLALAFASFAIPLAAQTLPKIDSKLLFHYVKYIERWPADSDLKVTEIKPSTVLPGLFEVTVERAGLGRIVGVRHYFVSSDGERFLKGDAFQVGEKPFEARIARLNRQASPSIGPADAPVTLAVYEDFQCPDCADDRTLLTEQLPAEFGKQIRVVFHDYPLARHKWAMPAAVAARCAFRVSNEFFWKYYGWVYSHQQEMNEGNFAAKLAEWAGNVNAGEAFTGCVANKASEKEVQESIADALALEVQGTPTLFLNGRMMPMLFPNGQMVPPDDQLTALKWMIQFELKVVPPADACCMAGPQ